MNRYVKILLWSLLLGVLTITGLFAWPNIFNLESYVLPVVMVTVMYAVFFVVMLATVRMKWAHYLFYIGICFTATTLPFTILLAPLRDYPLLESSILVVIFMVEYILLYGLPMVLFRFTYPVYRWATVITLPVLGVAAMFTRFELSQYTSLIPAPVGIAAECFTDIPPIIQMSSFTGILGVEYFVMFVAAVLGVVLWEWILYQPMLRAWLKPAETEKPMQGRELKQALMAAGASAVVLGGLILAGNIEALLVSKEQNNPSRVLRPGLLQTGTDAWAAENRGQAAQIATALSVRQQVLEALKKKADFIVYPEGSLPLRLPESGQMWKDVSLLSLETGLPAFVGAIVDLDEKSAASVWFFLNAQGRIAGYYTKQILFPFDDYFPLRALTESLFAVNNYLVGKVPEFFKLQYKVIAQKDYMEGKESKVFDTGKGKVFLTISPEWQYPLVVRDAVKKGGEVCLFPAGAEWRSKPVYFKSRLQVAAYRAVETRRWVVCTTCKDSALVDAMGIVRFRTPFNARTTVVRPIPCLTRMTFYTRFGDVFSWLCVFASFWFLGASVWQDHRKKSARKPDDSQSHPAGT